MLYLVLGVFLALIVVSGVLSEWMLWHVALRRVLPARAFAGQPYFVEVELRNSRGPYPIVAVEVEDLRVGAPADKRCFFLRVPPFGSQVAVYRRTASARGRYAFGGFRVVTRFPFGFFEKSVFVAADEELVVYPRIDPARPGGGDGSDGETDQCAVRGAGHESLGFRVGTESDSLRDVAWKLSARGGGLVAHERGAWVGSSLVVGFEEFPDSVPFEREIVRCASLLVDRVRAGVPCVLRLRGSDFLVGPGGGLDEALSALAVLERGVSRETDRPLPASVSSETPERPTIRHAGPR